MPSRFRRPDAEPASRVGGTTDGNYVSQSDESGHKRKLAVGKLQLHVQHPVGFLTRTDPASVCIASRRPMDQPGVD